MALSNTFSFTVNQQQLVYGAMLNIGALGEGEEPTSQEYTDVALRLSMMCKLWMEKLDMAAGLKMWQRARGDLFLSQSKGQYLLGPTSGSDNWAGGVSTSQTANYQQTQLVQTALAGATTLTVATSAIPNISVGDNAVVTLDGGDIASSTVTALNAATGVVTISTALPSQASANAWLFNYTIRGQRPEGILTGVLRDINNNDIPLNIMTLKDYEFLPTKTMPTFLQDPTAFYYESQFGSQLYTPAVNGPGVLYIDCGGAQDVTKHLHFVYLRPIMDITNPTDNLEYPHQWFEPLMWGLSRRIAPMFDAEWTPEMQANYDEATAFAKNADAETTSLYFEADADMSDYG